MSRVSTRPAASWRRRAPTRHYGPSPGAASSGRVPLTFLLTAVFWLSDEVQSILTRDGVSHAAHLAGALVGTAAGYAIHAGRGRAKRDPNRRVSDPFGRTRSAKKLR